MISAQLERSKKLNIIRIASIGESETVHFASRELYSYLKKIDSSALVDLCYFDEYNEDENYIWVGTSPKLQDKLPTVEDPEYDDAVYISVENFKGVITGANDRAVLIAVYRFLRELGVAFVRPTDDAEVIPEISLDCCRVFVSEKPSYRHRAICIEGANGEEHIKNMIDWLPKMGMNGYFIQFSNPFVFFVRWYEHWLNPLIDKAQITPNDTKAIKKKLEEEISRRSLMFHDVGHGWTCDAFGFDTVAWGQADDCEVSDKHRSFLALLDGKKALFRNCPMMSEFCYSNEEAKSFMIDSVTKYLEEHKGVTHIHFWLSDGFNNCCECDDCRDKNHADQYIGLLNALDERLSEKGIDTKVVFLIYSNLLWAPKSAEIKNKDRFILMFAPISRSYFDALDSVDFSLGVTVPEYIRNKMTSPKSLHTLVSMYKAWREKTLVHDSFDFDYHLWSAHFSDKGYYGISKIIAGDVRGLERLSLNGIVSCQLQRASIPTNLPMHTLATFLWNKDTNFEEMAKDYMEKAFGENYPLAENYLKKLTALMGKGFEVGSEEYKKISNDELIEDYKKAIAVNHDFQEKLKLLLSAPSSLSTTERKSFEYLSYHAEMVDLEAKLLIEKLSEKDGESTKRLAEELKTYARENEPSIHKVLDVWHFVRYVISNFESE